MLPEPYWQGGGITLYCGDSREIVPYLPRIDLLLSDPPYGTGELTGGYGRAQNHGGKGRQIANDGDLSVTKEVLALCRSKMDVGWLLAFCAPRRMQAALELVPDSIFWGEIIWDKQTPGLGKTVRYTHESALLFRIGEAARPVEPLLSIVRQQVSHVETQNRHPHEKPVKFWTHAMRLPGEIIVDPFCGTGGVLRAAKDMGRTAIGIELDEGWCKIAVEKLRQEVLL